MNANLNDWKRDFLHYDVVCRHSDCQMFIHGPYLYTILA